MDELINFKRANFSQVYKSDQIIGIELKTIILKKKNYITDCFTVLELFQILWILFMFRRKKLRAD